MIAAQIDAIGLVTNTIVVDSLNVIPGLIDGTGAAIGDTWDGAAFIRPPVVVLPPTVPQSVTRRQAKQALLLAGLLGNVQPALDAIPDATQRTLMQIEWDDSQEFERNRPSLIAIGAALGLDSAALDQLFITAAAL
jgi:hypothetical protein